MQKMIKAERDYTEVQDYFKNNFYIPNDWDYLQFSNAVLINPKTEIHTKRAFYIPMDAVNIETGTVDYVEERNISENGSLPKFQKNDILFARITPSTENGKVCIIEDFDYGIASSELIVLRPTNKVLPRYLFYFVKSDRIKKFAISQMMGTTGRQRVPDNVFKKYLRFELPSLEEQQKIASILSNVDELIQKIEQIIEQTQRLKKSLMQRLLTKGIGHTKFKKTELGEIPDSWQLVNINHIIKDKDGIKTGPFGSSLKKEIFVLTGYKIYGQENVIPDDFTIGDYFISEEIFLKMKKYEIKPGDILISLVGTHGKVSVVPDNIQRGIINPRLLRIRLDQNKVVPIYMKILLESDYIEKQTKKLAHGLTMGILNTNTIRQFNFVIPSIEEQRKIISIFFTINEKLKNMKDYKLKIELLKKGLMQQLLTGKIRVKV